MNLIAVHSSGRRIVLDHNVRRGEQLTALAYARAEFPRIARLEVRAPNGDLIAASNGPRRPGFGSR